MEPVKFSDDEIRKMLTKLKFIKKDRNLIAFEIGSQKFNMTIPENSTECYFIDLPTVVNGYEWLNRINEYVLDKQPTFERLLKYIEQRFEKENKKLKTT